MSKPSDTIPMVNENSENPETSAENTDTVQGDTFLAGSFRALDDSILNDDTWRETPAEIAARFTLTAADTVLETAAYVPYLALHAVTVARASRVPLWRKLRHLAQEEQAARTVRRDNDEPYTLEEFDRLHDIKDHQRRVEEHVSLYPDVERVLLTAASSRPVSRVVNETKWAWQRVTRGWDDRAIWSLDYHIYRTLGEQLAELARVAHGYPGTEEYPDYESWVRDLNYHSEKLLTAANGMGDKEFSEFGGIEGYINEENRILTEARESLEWVAKHAPSLWD